MKLFTRKFRKDARGFSLIEMICAVAILGAISTAIGGAMVVSSNSYKRGTTETEIQQDSHFTANVIEGLIVDATNEVNFDASSKTLEIKNIDYTHVIKLDTTTNELKYTCKYPTGGAVSPESVLASDVEDFNVNASNFAESRNAQVTIKMKRDNSEIGTVYNVTSRNNPASSIPASFTPVATISGPTKITLEPNQVYTFNITVTATGGASSAVTASLIGAGAGDTSASVNSTNTEVTVEVGAHEYGTGGEFVVALQSSTGEIHNVTVNVRRVNDFDMSEVTFVSGTPFKKDAVYTVTARPVGTHLDRDWAGATTYDQDYKSPYGAIFSFEASAGPWNNYVEVVNTNEEGNPSVIFKLKEDMGETDVIRVTARAKHPDGIVNGVQTNKTGSDYDEVTKTKILKKTAHATSPFLRGSDVDMQFTTPIPWGDIKDAYGGNAPYNQIRFRPVVLDAAGNFVSWIAGEDWGEWQDVTDHGTAGDTHVFIRPGDYSLAPHYAYAAELKLRYGNSATDITWPIEGTTPKADYTIEFYIPRTTIQFNSCADYPGGTFPVGCVGAYQSSPLVFKGDNTVYWIQASANATHSDKFMQNNLTYELQNTTTGQTAYLQEFGMSATNTENFTLKMKMPVVSEATPSGTVYKLTLKWRDGLYDEKDLGETNQPIANETTGEGIFYIKVI